MKYFIVLSLVLGLTVLSSCGGRKGDKCPSVGKTMLKSSDIKIS